MRPGAETAGQNVVELLAEGRALHARIQEVTCGIRAHTESTWRRIALLRRGLLNDPEGAAEAEREADRIAGERGAAGG